MKKRMFAFVGLSISLIGAILIIKNLSLTGFAISETINDATSYFLPLVLFIGGILMAVSNDGLQSWLERKEKESPSPSLEGKLENTEETRQFGKRYSGKHSFFKRLAGKRYVEQVPQKAGIGDGKEDYTGKFSSSYLLGQRKTELEILSKRISEERKKLVKSKKGMDISAELGDAYGVSFDAETYSNAIERLRDLYEQMETAFPIDNYKALKKAIAKKGFKKGLEELRKDITENRASFGTDRGLIAEKGNGLARLKEVEKMQEQLPRIQELIDLYIHGAKTVPVSEVSQKYGVYVTHGINDLWREKGRQDRGVMAHNVPGLSEEERRNMGFKDYFKILTQDKPMISTATVRGKEKPLGPVGVILTEGKVYDAESEDLLAEGLPGGNRYRKGGLHSIHDINTRIGEAITGRNPNYNELIVGGDYKIGGLYLRDFVLDKLNSGEPQDQHFKELIRDTAQQAIQSNLPLYRASEEGGFAQINPQEYLPGYRKPVEVLKYSVPVASSKKKSVKRTTRRKAA